MCALLCALFQINQLLRNFAAQFDLSFIYFSLFCFFSRKCVTLSHVTKVISVEDRIFRMHDWVREAYSWPRVAQRTELVYYTAVSRKRLDFKSLLDRYSTKIGGAYSTTLRVLARIHRLLLHLAAWFRPTH
ncbi:Phosphatidylinositol glycan class A [Fasciola hepatica]|uniref:Phosphatidylinositol glycan class A n=1 Tax=Fasciola hepatica TaxID=6192 RepID=A0A4E0RND2_FASHE|nr:Phosphatidylinositol glycan class A [Fasciola hepatica]